MVIEAGYSMAQVSLHLFASLPVTAATCTVLDADTSHRATRPASPTAVANVARERRVRIEIQDEQRTGGMWRVPHDEGSVQDEPQISGRHHREAALSSLTSKIFSQLSHLLSPLTSSLSSTIFSHL